jgi:hypothetical protein
VRDLLEFILNGDLKLEHLLLILLVLNLLSHLLGLHVHACLVETLSVIELVGVDFWVELGQLVVHLGRLGVVLDVEVTVAQER